MAKQGKVAAKKPASRPAPAKATKPAKATRPDARAAAKAECAAVAAEAAARTAAPAPAAARSAPIPYGPDIAQAILDRVAAGESVRSITRDPAMPSSASVFNWLRAHPEFAEAYGEAKRTGLQLMADELLDIVDDGSNDWIERRSATTGELKGYEYNGEAVARSKLRAETRRWLLERLEPSKYAPSSTVKHTGAVGVVELEVEPEHALRVAQAIIDGMAPASAQGQGG